MKEFIKDILVAVAIVVLLSLVIRPSSRRAQWRTLCMRTTI